MATGGREEHRMAGRAGGRTVEVAAVRGEARPEALQGQTSGVGRTAGMRGLGWTAREEEGSAVLVGTETNSGKVTVIGGGNDEGELLQWTRRDKEGLGSCGGV